MAVEIERKFLVTSNAWRDQVRQTDRLRQGYIAGSEGCSVRLRIQQGQAKLGLKSRVAGMRRLEYEYGIPMDDGAEIFESLCVLGRIEKLIARFKPEALIIVGDLIHSSTSLPPDFMADLNRWFESLPCPSLLVRGNHDPSARKLDDLPALEHCEHYQLGIFHFVHDPEDAPPDIPTVTGHLHPLCRVGTKQGPQIRVPCFLHHNNCLTLPAFGTFTSGNMTRPETGKCYPVVQGKVFPAF